MKSLHKPVWTATILLSVSALGCAAEPAPKKPETAAAAPPNEAEALAEARRAIPSGSADYANVLAGGILYKKGQISFAALTDRILARKLPPHPQGDAYLEMSPSVPPPGVAYDSRIMPSDWVGTWGEVRMLVGQYISEEQYRALHEKAHPTCKKP